MKPIFFMVVITACAFPMERNNNRQQHIKIRDQKIPLHDSRESDESYESDDQVNQPYVKIIKPPLAKYLATKRIVEGYEFDINLDYTINKNNFFNLIRNRRNTKKYECCDKQHTWSGLKSHLRLDHKRNTEYVCYTAGCDKKVKSIAMMLSHIALHSHPDLFICPFCNKLISSEISIRNHFGLCTDIPQDVDVREHYSPVKPKKVAGKEEASHTSEHRSNSSSSMRSQSVSHVNNAIAIAAYYAQANTNMTQPIFSIKDEINTVIAKCRCCGVALHSWMSGVNHFYYIHRIDSEYICSYDQCSKRYARPEEALGCLLQHTHPLIFTCHRCKARYNTYQMVVDHWDTHQIEYQGSENTLVAPTVNAPSIANNQAITHYVYDNQHAMPVYQSASDIVAEYQQPYSMIIQQPPVQSWSELLDQRPEYYGTTHEPYSTWPYSHYKQ